MSFAARMSTADDIVSLFQEYSIYDSSTIKDSAAGKAVDIGGLKHHQLAAQGTAEAPVRAARVRTKDKVGHVELQENKGKGAKTTALKERTAHLVDAEGNLKPGVDPKTIFDLSAQVEEEFKATSAKGRGTLEAFYHAAAVPSLTVPCYRLPWNPTGTAMRLRIPSRGGGGPTAAHPILFLTAALSGCSLYVSGTPKEPVIHHCGTEGQTDKSVSARRFWDTVMKQLGIDAADASVGSADVTQYMTPKRGKAGVAEAERKEAQKSLATQYKNALKIEKTSSWGAMFGVRDVAGDWRFYLQQNTSISYYKVRVTSTLKRTVKVGEEITVSRPIVLSQIYPSTGGGATRLYEDALKALPDV